MIKIERKFVKSAGFSAKNLSTSARNSPSKSKHTSANDLNSSILITLYFKRYFTQTINFVYKISYLVTPKIVDSSQFEYEMGDSPKTLTENILKVSEIDKDSNEMNPNLNISNNSKAQLLNNAKPTKSISKSNTQHQKKFFVEIWLSWNFLHVKSKYQNLVLIEKVRQSLISIRQADFDRSFDITSFILNPPEILKLKEPLFKISASNVNAQNAFENENNIIYNRNRVSDLIFSIENLNYELNMRSSKITSDQFIDFAQSWVYLSFDKYNKNIMDRYFGIHNVKLILNYDRPMPDTSAVLFDLKNIMVLMKLEIYSNSLYGAKNLNNNNSNFYAFNEHNAFNDNTHLTQEHIATLNNLGYSNAINRNQSATKNNIFQCKISLNKLCAMLIEWSDIMLVENCVYLKFLTSSTKYLKSSGTKKKIPGIKNACIFKIFLGGYPFYRLVCWELKTLQNIIKRHVFSFKYRK